MKLGALLLLVAFLTSGCELLCVVDPAHGRVVDAQTGIPIKGAKVTRICNGYVAKKTKTNHDGYFRFYGKWIVTFPLGDALVLPAIYRVEATGYETSSTNETDINSTRRFMPPHWATASPGFLDVGVIELKPAH